jgi:hypothetical protein
MELAPSPWLGAALAGTAFVTTLLLSLPVETLVRQQAGRLEEQTGLRLAWKSGTFSVWSSSLREVAVFAPSGRQAATFEHLDIRLAGPGSLTARSQGGPCALRAAVSTQQAEVEVTNLALDWAKLPADSALSLAGSTLSGTVRWSAPEGRLEARFGWQGGLHRKPLFDGPVEVQGHLEARGPRAHVVLDSLQGEGLRGRGSLDLTNLGTREPLHLDGQLEAELNGLSTTLAIQGTPDNLTLAPAATPPKRGI